MNPPVKVEHIEFWRASDEPPIDAIRERHTHAVRFQGSIEQLEIRVLMLVRKAENTNGSCTCPGSHFSCRDVRLPDRCFVRVRYD
jgi:hypothetical protein